MIRCSLYVNYLNQFYRCDKKMVIQVLQEIKNMFSSFGASIESRDFPLHAEFDQDGPFALLQAAEAIYRTQCLLQNAAAELRGATLIVYREQDEEDMVRAFRLQNLGGRHVVNLFFMQSTTNLLAPYFSFTRNSAEFSTASYRYTAVRGQPGLQNLLYRPAMVKALANYIDSHKNGEFRLLFVKTDLAAHSAKILETVCTGLKRTGGRANSTALTLYAPFAGKRTLAPFTTCLDDTILQTAYEKAEDTERTSLDQLRPAFAYLQRAAELQQLPAALVNAAAAYVNTVLDIIGRGDNSGQVWIVCDRPDQFTEEAAELITVRLSSGRGKEKYLAAGSVLPPQCWHTLDDTILSMVSCIDEDLEQIRKQLAGEWPEQTRDLLQARAENLLNPENQALCRVATARLLAWLPPEAGLYSYCLALTGVNLDRSAFRDFLNSAGLQDAGIVLIEEILVHFGLMDPQIPGLLLQPVAVPEPATLEHARLMEDRYTAFLVMLYRKGILIPSVQLLQRTGEQNGDQRFSFDCVMNSALRPDSDLRVDTAFLSPASRVIFSYYQAAARNRRNEQANALAESSEYLQNDHYAGTLALMQAEYAYAEGRIETLAQKAREALLLIKGSAPPRLAARVQRIMGLSALTLEKFTDAGDYLTNAAEIAEAAGEQYESSNALYIRGIADYVSGSIVKAARSIRQAIDKTTLLCRPDMAVHQGMLLARIDMDLGLYDSAEQHYAELAAIADDHGLAAAADRARIWQGRCLAYAGQLTEASEILKKFPADREAVLFLSEMDVMNGQPEKAMQALETRVHVQNRDFLPPDSFNDSSLLQETEGRCIAFDENNAVMNDMAQALYYFADGLANRKASRASDLAALTRIPRIAKNNPSLVMYCMYCYLLEEELQEEPVDKQTVLSRAFNALQQRAGKIEDRSSRSLFMEKNIWNRRLVEAAKEHKFL